ncbi:MAG: hypothetical protein JWO03_3896 [Bacteroidetes bacterium]|nr:hypothetical protein [Bacteroidota bacterium]
MYGQSSVDSTLDQHTSLKNAIDTISAELHFKIGKEEMQRTNYSEALKHFNSAIEKDSLKPDYYNARGTVHGLLGCYSCAIVEFEKAMSVDPKALKALFNRGSTRYFIGDYMGSIIDLTRFIELSPQGCGSIS